MQKYVLVLVEGFTEEIFYRRIKELFHSSARSKIENLKGNWNIDQKILDYVSRHAEANTDTKFSVSICIDRESRFNKAPINMEVIRSELASYPNIDPNGIKLFEAIQDLESWFFHDIDGIYSFLRAPAHQRKPNKYRPVEQFNNRDLSKLFAQFNKEYEKGKGGQNFINRLDLNKIKNGSQVLSDFCSFLSNF